MPSLHETLARWLAKGGPKPEVRPINVAGELNEAGCYTDKIAWFDFGDSNPDVVPTEVRPVLAAAIIDRLFADNLRKVLPGCTVEQVRFLDRTGVMWAVCRDDDMLRYAPTIWQAVGAAMETLEA
jgi:hypothetical protein